MQANPFNAVDASTDKRPGVPERKAPSFVGNARWTTPDKQAPDADVTRDESRDELTATFGTAPKPHGVSGLIRRAAYRIPDYRARRWAILLLADRIDALESNLVDLPKSPVAWAALASTVAAGVWAYRSRSQS